MTGDICHQVKDKHREGNEGYGLLSYLLKTLNIHLHQAGDTRVNHRRAQLQPNVLSAGHVTPGLFLPQQKG